MRNREATTALAPATTDHGSYQTRLSPLECQERLLDAIDRHSGDHIHGTVTTEKFELHRGTRVRAGAYPVLRGSLTPTSEGTRVTFRVTMSRPKRPFARVAAAIWALMAFSWVVFFVYWIVDPDGIDIGLPRLLLLLGIVVLMGATIAAGRRTDEQGGEELIDIVRSTLPSVEESGIANGGWDDR